MEDPMNITCSRCGGIYERPYNLSTSTFQQCQYVCENCRCKDCSIVLGFECECGERHAEPSLDNPQICSECAIIRQRITSLDPELLKIRSEEISKEDPLQWVPESRSATGKTTHIYTTEENTE